jgi:SAM-dependent methyltransferase
MTDAGDDIVHHYTARYDEESRLGDDLGRVEAARTRKILLRHLPPPPADVLDVGGGPGHYATWLADLGHRVRLVDLVPRHVDQATEAGIDAVVGNAMHLDEPNSSWDAVLLLGPLYHLQERGDRMQALGEARRVLRPDGPLFAAAVSRFAPLIDGLDSGHLEDDLFRQIVAEDLTTGRHINLTGDPAHFTTAYFHHPDELASEVTEAGFRDVEVLAVEGIAWAARDLGERWADPERRAVVEDFLRRLEREPSLMGASPHLLAVGWG